MCQSNAFIVKANGEEVKILEDVATILPKGEKLHLINLFGEEEIVDAKIKEINLLTHRILLEER